MWSVPSRRRLFSHSRMIQRRELPAHVGVVAHGAVNLGGEHDVVAPALDAPWPTISSDSPAEYTSAVSMKLMPASSAAWMIAIESSWSGLPHCAEHHGPEARGG